ncbi:hypothetical protein L3V82_03535 [Thiotrichales bacterium 19S3-7]|nr:hypothetical protein [Thiotrichales bacterium 19S3-7]MCF6801281.1 hypothetical protein [Thiotrichales bacterium 19S3-11]
MSTINDVISAASNLTETVANQCQTIDRKLAELDQIKLELLQREKQAYFPYWRLSRNQLGSITDGRLDYFNTIIEDIDVKFEVYRRFKSGIPWEERDQEEQQILTAMGKEEIMHTMPEFNIVRMQWHKKNDFKPARLFFQYVNYHNWVTYGCYAKLISGKLKDDGVGYFNNLSDQWGLCGNSLLLNKTSYFHPHSYVESKTGEILFCLLTAVAGRLLLDRNKPRWGYFPYVQTLED